jgi:uncharacterized protein (DUF927 family)
MPEVPSEVDRAAEEGRQDRAAEEKNGKTEPPKKNGGAGPKKDGESERPKKDDENERKKRLLEWREKYAEKVLKLVHEDVALHFLDNVDDEENTDLDLKGEFDPIVDEKTGARLSDAIAEFAEEIKLPEKALQRLYKATLKEKYEKQKAPLPTDPAGRLYGKHYLVNRHGVWARQNAGTTDLFVWRRITRTRIDHQALSYDTSPQQNSRHHYLITNETGERSVSIGSERLSKHADSAIAILMRHGAHIVESKEARQHLAVFLRYKPRARIVRVPSVGWFEPKKGTWVFVLPTETLGDIGGKYDIILDTVLPDHHGFHHSGTSEQWREHVAKPLAGNSNVLLAVGVFLAAPLLRWADESGGGFHFFGTAKIGKTLISAVGQSVWGKPYKPGGGVNSFGFTWETTTNRLGERAVLRSDVGLYLDEIGIGDQRAIASSVFKLASGSDKGRFGQAEKHFRILFLSTGNLSLAEFLPKNAPKNAQEGPLVRMVDISAEIQRNQETAFETIAKSGIAAAGRKYYPATDDYHGAVGYDWLSHLVALGPTRIKVELRRLHKAWRALPQVEEIESRANPQVASMINRFALVAAALNMASTAGIVPWTATDIDTAIIACMQRWLYQRGNIDTGGELLREVERVQQLVAAIIDDRFIHLVLKNRRLIPATAADRHKIEASEDGFDGYVKDDGRILLKPEAWRRLWAGLDIDAMKKHLLDKQLLIPDREGLVPSVEKINGKPVRVYVLAPAFVGNVTT